MKINEEISPQSEQMPDEVATPVEAAAPQPVDIPASVAESEDQEPKPESKIRIFFRKLLRWTLAILIVFGIGYAVAVFTLYIPETKQHASTEQALTAIQGQVADLEAQVSALESTASDTDAKLVAQTELELQMALLSARVDVANARLALAENDTASAQLSLAKTDTTLKWMQNLLPVEQQNVIAAMTQRLDLVLSEIADNPYAAQSDLDVLATNLLQLQDAVFGAQ